MTKIASNNSNLPIFLKGSWQIKLWPTIQHCPEEGFTNVNDFIGMPFHRKDESERKLKHAPFYKDPKKCYITKIVILKEDDIKKK